MRPQTAFRRVLKKRINLNHFEQQWQEPYEMHLKSHYNLYSFLLFAIRTMQDNFQSLPEQEQTCQLYSQVFPDGQDCHASKKSTIQWFWQNLQRIVSIMVIVYFLILIVNLMALQQPHITLPTLTSSDNQSNTPKMERTIAPHQIQSIMGDRNTLTARLNLQNHDELPQEYLLPEKRLFQLSTVFKQISQPPIQKTNERMAETKHQISQSKALDPSVPSHTPQDFNQMVNYKQLLKEIAQQEWETITTSKYTHFGQIYSEIDQKLRRTVHSTSREERESIISKYFKQHQQNQHVEELLKENYQLRAGRSTIDTVYLQLMTEQYQFAQQEQTFICVVLNTQNNAYNGQINRTLNSIFNQQYREYQVVIADAESSDETVSQIEQYLSANEHFKERTRLMPIEGKSHAFAVLSAVRSCRDDSLVVMLDGNTELIGKQAFSIIDSERRLANSVVLYSNHYTLDVSSGTFSLFRAQKYDQSQKFMAIYRNSPSKYGRIIVAKAATLQSIPLSHIRHNDEYFQYSGLDSIAVSLLELSCGRMKTIDEPIALAILDSSIAGAEREDRIHELQLIAMKDKLSVC